MLAPPGDDRTRLQLLAVVRWMSKHGEGIATTPQGMDALRNGPMDAGRSPAR